MPGIKRSFCFERGEVNDELHALMDVIYDDYYRKDGNRYVWWWYEDNEILKWSYNEEYDDDSTITFDDCVKSLKYIISRLKDGYVLVGSAIWCDMNGSENDNTLIRKITVRENVIETSSVAWVSDEKCTKSDCKK